MKTSRLTSQLAAAYGRCFHVRDVGLVGCSDDEIRHCAACDRHILVTKAIGFYRRSMLRGHHARSFGPGSARHDLRRGGPPQSPAGSAPEVAAPPEAALWTSAL